MTTTEEQIEEAEIEDELEPQDVESEIEEPEEELGKQEAEDVESDAEGDDSENDEDAESELEIVIEGENADPENEEQGKDPFAGKPAPKWAKDLRKENKELKKQLRERQKREASQPQAVESPGEMPDPYDPKYDYDKEKYQKDLRIWQQETAAFEKQEQEAKQRQKQEAEAWQATLERHEKQKKSLPVEDWDEVEESIGEKLSETQHALLVKAPNSALLKVLLHRKPELLEQVSKITDPVDYVYAVADLQNKVRTAPRKKPSTSPERKVDTSARISSTKDAQLEKLREQAAKTNDYSKVREYKQKHGIR